MYAAPNVHVPERVDVEVQLVAHFFLIQRARPVEARTSADDPRLIKSTLDGGAVLRRQIRVRDRRRKRSDGDRYAPIVEELVESRRLERATRGHEQVGRRPRRRRQGEVQSDPWAHGLVRFARGPVRRITGLELVGDPIYARAE